MADKIAQFGSTLKRDPSKQMQPGPPPARKRSSISHTSKKRKAYRKSTNTDRDQWKAEHPYCFACLFEFGRLEPAADCHEIERKSQAPYTWAQPVNYFAACRRHHDLLGSVPDFGAEWPHARQLAAKWLWLCQDGCADPQWPTLSAFLQAWRKVKPRTDKYVTVSDVVAFLGGRAVA